ncbi:MAG TPA: hypothetical protein VJL33_04995 [Candidatus Bathyarchaeia archaeon]|nr:hypothetical protein [Candidatus Bathyarchaeia archaeon]
MVSNIDFDAEAVFLSEANKRKEKIAEFKNLLLKELMTLPKDNLVCCVKEITEIMEKTIAWALKLAGIAQRNIGPPQLKHIDDISFLKTAIFHSFFEGLYLSYVNVICLLLVRNGHDLYNTFTRKYCLELNDIEVLDSCTKLEFLKMHGFGIVVRNDDRQLRNKFAHLDYTIIDEDKIKVKGNIINLHERSNDLFAFVMALNMLTAEALNLLRKQHTRH